MIGHSRVLNNKGAHILKDLEYNMASSREAENQLASDRQRPSDRWYAVRVRSNCESRTVMHLRERGYEELAPSYQTERRWSDRKKLVEQFLFPGYVFCRLDVEHRLPVLTAPGVVGLV